MSKTLQDIQRILGVTADGIWGARSQAALDAAIRGGTTRQIGQKGLDLIKRFEGLKLRSYKCPAGVWTIGYGHTGNVTANQIITSEQAEQLLRSDLRVFEKVVSDAVTVPLNQNQFDALVSLAFNIGGSNFGSSTLLRMLNAANYAGAANQFERWNQGGGKVLQGLVKRRDDERRLFVSK